MELPLCGKCGNPTEFSLDGKIALCKACLNRVIHDGGELERTPKKKKAKKMIPLDVGTQIFLKDRPLAVTVVASKEYYGSIVTLFILHRQSPNYEVILFDLSDDTWEPMGDSFEFKTAIALFDSTNYTKKA